MFILCPSTLLWPHTLVVNHVCHRLADGRLGSALPALWVCLRQMGLCIHLLAPCLPTVRSAQVSRGAHAAFLDLSSPQGLCFQLLPPLPPTRCWLWSRNDSVSSPRSLAQDKTRETFSPFFFFKLSFSYCTLTTPGPITAQCAHVYCTPHWAGTVQKRHRDFLLLLLISTWRRKWPICWNWFGQWLASLDLKLYSESCCNKVSMAVLMLFAFFKFDLIYCYCFKKGYLSAAARFLLLVITWNIQWLFDFL